MIQLTKIFHFETAHAIHGYEGACKHIHGHSYELHVTVRARENNSHYIPAPGFIIDFKEIKKLVQSYIIEPFDHRLLLSSAYLAMHPNITHQENLIVWEVEPTAENLLLYIADILNKQFPGPVKLSRLKLFETKDSYAEWSED